MVIIFVFFLRHFFRWSVLFVLNKFREQDARPDRQNERAEGTCGPYVFVWVGVKLMLICVGGGEVDAVEAWWKGVQLLVLCVSVWVCVCVRVCT